MTNIITTIGPASLNNSTLAYFATHGVKIARLNFSHGTSQWHIEAGKMCKEHGLELMFDLAGPKVLLGQLANDTTVANNEEIAIEQQKECQTYPYEAQVGGAQMRVFPCQFAMNEFVSVGTDVLVNDGYMEWKVRSIQGDRVVAHVEFGGVVKSNKGVNLPGTKLDIHFLVDRDLELIAACLPALQPAWIAPSFVKTVEDLHTLKAFIEEVKQKNNMPANYQPKICTKIEMHEAVEPESLEKITQESDMLMVARGDLALETKPAHLMVPFLQDAIVNSARKQGKLVIIATQMMESMIESPVPTRAEISDLYRAIHINKADFVMLSAESAVGKFPEKCVNIMYSLAKMGE